MTVSPGRSFPLGAKRDRASALRRRLRRRAGARHPPRRAQTAHPPRLARLRARSGRRTGRDDPPMHGLLDRGSRTATITRRERRSRMEGNSARSLLTHIPEPAPASRVTPARSRQPGQPGARGWQSGADGAVMSSRSAPLRSGPLRRRRRSLSSIFADSDPIGLGLVPSLPRSGGNVTGVVLGSMLADKRLALLIRPPGDSG
jgi:hypothetical protein